MSGRKGNVLGNAAKAASTAGSLKTPLLSKGVLSPLSELGFFATLRALAHEQVQQRTRNDEGDACPEKPRQREP